MINDHRGFSPELHTSPKLVAAVMLGLGVITVVVGDIRFSLTYRERVLAFAVLLFIVSGLIWLLETWQPRVGRWFTLITMVFLIKAGIGWLAIPEFLILLGLPVILAVALIGFGAAIIITLGETLLVLLWPYYGPDPLNPASLVMSLIAIWGSLYVLYLAYRPMNQLAGWSWSHFLQAQQALEEARDRKLALEQALNTLAHANRELALLTEKLKVMRHIAEEAQKAKATFLARVSHEFRTPLNMIIGLVDTLLETPVYKGELSPALLRDLEVVYRNSNHLAGMINDVLDLSQTETGQLHLESEWADLGEDVARVLAVIQPLLEKKRLQWCTLIPEPFPRLYYDRVRLRQVLLNLASNAARFTMAGGITVRAAQEGRYVIVSLADTGPGIAPEDVEKVFEPFYQSVSGSRSNHGGSGLGLSISKQLIELHGGQIWLESRLGEGTTFYFKLPIFPALPPPVDPKALVSEDWVWQERPEWPALPPLPYQKRVILCDETGTLYPLVSRQATTVEFVDTLDLSQATQELKSHPAHLLLLNAASPDRLPPLLEQARRAIPDIPLAGCCLPAHTEVALEAGAVDYLIKPIRQAELKAVIQAIDAPIQRVLVVDDNPDVQELFTRMLQLCDPSLEVITAASGQQCLETLYSQPPDLVLLDVIMPELDGWQVLAKIQDDKTLKDIPVVMISGEDLIRQPASSPMIWLTIGGGVTLNKVLDCSLQLSALLLKAD